MDPVIPAVMRDDESAGFFEAAARGVLAVRTCANGHRMPPVHGYSGPAARCHDCLSEAITWEPVTGRGALVSWVVVRDRDGAARHVAGIVELDEGPWLNGLILVPPGARLRAGCPVVARFVPSDGGEVVPAFVPVEDLASEGGPA